MTKEELLEQVWEEFTFEDIITFGLQSYKITSSDIVDMADIYEKNDDTNDLEKLEDVIENLDLSIIIDNLRLKYTDYEIIEEFDQDSVISCLDDIEMLKYLEDSGALSEHDEDIKDEYFKDMYENIKSDILYQDKLKYEEISNKSPDDLRKLFCNMFRISYYDDENFIKCFKELFSKLRKSTYTTNKKIKIEDVI